MAKRSEKCPPELIRLEKTVGGFMEYWGFKRIHGRIWTHLFTSSVPLDSIALMERLKVSKGLMSLAIRDLLEYQVIQPAHVGKHGTTFYVANPDLVSVITNVLKTRETKMLQEARQAGDAIKKLGVEKLKSHSLDPARVQNVIDLTSSAQLILSTFLEQDLAGTQLMLFAEG